MWTVERFPQLRPALWRSFYRALAAYSRRAEYWTFMNYDYVDDPGSRPELAPEDQEERYSIYLYHRVAAWVELSQHLHLRRNRASLSLDHVPNGMPVRKEA
jgi:hypothetical protein